MKNDMDFKEGEIVSVRAIKNTDLSIITELPFNQNGYNSINLVRCGKNLINQTVEIITNLKEIKCPRVLPQTNYSLTYKATSDNLQSKLLVYGFIKRDGKEDAAFWEEFNNGQEEVRSFTSTAPIDLVYVYAGGNWDSAQGHTLYLERLQLEFGLKSSSYEEYKDNKYSITFPQKIYKGSYNWTTGELDGFSDVELKTPYKVKLIPQKIKSFGGTNNIWSSEGNTKVGYYSLDDKVVICAVISNGILKIPTDKRYVVLGTNNFIEFQFDFIENQDMKNVIIEFEKDGIKSEGVLDKDNRIKLPQGITDGDLFIRIKDKITSKYLSKNKLKVVIDKNIYKIV